MRKLTISLAAMALFFAGCQKPELVEPEVKNLSFEATVEEFDTQTKTSLTSWNYIVWSAGDRLAIFQGSVVADEFLLAEGCAGQNKGTFDLVEDNSAVNGSFSAGTEPPCNVAFYPYSEGLNLTGEMEGKNAAYVLSNVVLPATQVHVANSFSNGSFPMVAVSESMGTHKLKFKNVLGAVKLSLKGTQTVKSIKIEGANGERLSGAATVTAYSNNLPPVITMTGTDEASKSVTLDCCDGVQLNEAVATNFYISLPPVLFEKGFKVVVKDAADQEYTMVSKENSVVLRSSILAMPEVTLGAEEPENPDEEDLVIPVLSVILNPTSLKLYEEVTAQLEVKVKPADATYKSVVWSSSDATVATVDQAGLVRAVSVGTARIRAQIENFVVTCTVTVSSCVATVATVDYIDEYGINHGKGTAVGMAVWAPVNCGYHATDFKYGKLYQWGRKYGQGYDGSLYDDKMLGVVGSFTDATVPELSEGGISLQGGQSANNENVFFIGTDDWLFPQDGTLWNSGTEESPVKTKYDPCPEGWRVPTYAELEELSQNHSEWTINENNQPGYWFRGSSSYSSEVAQVFFPAAGYRDYDGNAIFRGGRGKYCSSRSNDTADYLDLYSSGVYMSLNPRANGYSVRCVQNASGEPVPNGEDENLYIPVLSISLNMPSIKIYEDGHYQLIPNFMPVDATDQTVVWKSENPAVATIDHTGLVTAVSDGSTSIYAMAGDQMASCSVTVVVKDLAEATADYVDEYGINHGKGTAIGKVVWAPVNCGYHATDYQWGKLYQWGRKYGQGYDGDATTPEFSEGGVSLQGGQSVNNENVFFIGPYDWLFCQDGTLWNSGTEESPKKTEYDPCPQGWRVPTYAELEELCQNHSEWTNNVNGQPGYWFSGSSSYSSEVAQVFFPAASNRDNINSNADHRGFLGSYWSSKPNFNSAYYLYFIGGYTLYMNNYYRAYGHSVRCVQD